jgi:hypothetical protein
MDFLIVHSNWKGKKSSIHNSQIDATMYDSEEFLQKLKEHSFHEMVCVWLPSPFVWKELLDPKKHFKLDLPSLQASIFEETDRDWRMAQKYMEKDNLERGKKTIVHALRLVLLAIQIAKQGEVTDFHASCKYSNQLLQMYEEKSWSDYNTRYTPVFLRLRNSLSALTSP